MPRLTQVAHEKLAVMLGAGDYAIDATAGNGHDTRFLAEQVAPSGRVLAIDRQASALRQTECRLGTGALRECVTLVEGDHAQLRDIAPAAWRGRVRAIVFNLGYLPGSDKTVVTGPSSTRAALEASLTLLAPGGLLSVLIYRGHPGGCAEETMILDWLTENTAEFRRVEWDEGDHPSMTSPRLLTAIRRDRL